MLFSTCCIKGESTVEGVELTGRVPFFSAPNLTALWKSKAPGHTARVLKYFFQRVVIYAEVVASAEIVSKNA